jgi:F0F1-type ATP synthase gamma subunit
MNFNEVSVDRLSLGRLEDSTTVSSQRIAWVNYDGKKNNLILRTPLFITETYGVPRQGQYYPTDKARAFFKMPFCHERAEFKEDLDYDLIQQFYEKMLELDKFFGSEERKVELFGEKLASKYEYQPLVREPERSEEEEDSKAYRPPYMKVKLPLQYETEIPNFRLVNKKPNGEKITVDLVDFSDVVKHMRFLTKHRMILEFQKVYAMRTASGNDKRKYGLTVRLLTVECTNNSKDEEKANRFILEFDD